MYCPSKIAIAAGQDACSSTYRFGSAAPWVHEIRLQPIVDRQECVIGYETLARISADAFGASMESAIGALSLNALGQLTREVLLGLRIRCMLDTHYTRREEGELAPAAVRHFVNVKKLSLTDPAIVEELIESAADLRSSGARLVVEVTERPVATPAQFAAYLRGLMRLKQEEVLVALDDYDLNSPVHWELDLGLCDVVKLELGRLGIVEPYDEENFAIRHAALAEQLFGMIHRNRIELLAERVETDWQYEVVKGLSFNLSGVIASAAQSGSEGYLKSSACTFVPYYRHQGRELCSLSAAFWPSGSAYYSRITCSPVGRMYTEPWHSGS